MIELHFMVIEIIRHVLVDDFRISRYHRAIEMVRSRFVFHCFIIDGWIEYPLYAVLDEPLYMTVNHLCRVTRSIRRNGVHSALIYVLVCRRTQNDSESELCEERVPERIVLVHIKDSRYAYDASLCVFFIKYRPVEEEIVLDLIEIRKL